MNGRRLLSMAAGLAAVSVAVGAAGAAGPPRLINLSHLDHLSRPTRLGGEAALAVATYASWPDFRPEGAAGEGVACVDDVGRAAVAMLAAYRLQPDGALLERARRALVFVLRLQAPDGLFFNFVNEDGSINRWGVTSRRSLDFWTSRGLWALGEGVAVFDRTDPVFADRLHRAATLTVVALRDQVAGCSGDLRVDGRSVPAICVVKGTDCWSEALLGLVALQRARPCPATGELIRVVATALSRCRAGGPACPPFGGFYVWGGRPWTWHGWGSRQAVALIEASRAMGEPAWMDAARREVLGLHAHLLTCGVLAGLEPVPADFPQLAYTVAPLVQAAAALHAATGERRFAVMAGLAGAWFFGDNPTGKPLYDPATGRCQDGVDASGANRNSGAESTIEALLALLALESVPEAAAFLHARVTKRSARCVVERPLGGWAGAGAEVLVREGARYALAGCLLEPAKGPLRVLVDGRAAGALPGGARGPRSSGTVVRLAAGGHRLTLAVDAPALRYVLLLPVPEVARWRLPDGSSVQVERSPVSSVVRVREDAAPAR